MSLTITDGQLDTKDPNDIVVRTVDWDVQNLPLGVTLTSSSFTITVVSGDNTTPLTKDNEIILAGNRKTQVRLLAGTLGTLYKIDNQVVTNESPAQTKNRCFFLLVQDK